MFLHYDQLLSSQGISRLASLTEAEITSLLPNPELRKVYAEWAVTREADDIYKSLSDLAEFNP